MIYAIWPGNMCYAEAFHIVAAQQHPSRHQTDKNFCHADGKKRSFRISCAWTPNACLQNVGSVITFMKSAYAIWSMQSGPGNMGNVSTNSDLCDLDLVLAKNLIQLTPIQPGWSMSSSLRKRRQWQRILQIGSERRASRSWTAMEQQLTIEDE